VLESTAAPPATGYGSLTGERPAASVCSDSSAAAGRESFRGGGRRADRGVALKILQATRRSTSARSRFHREFRPRRDCHPASCRSHGVGVDRAHNGSRCSSFRASLSVCVAT
jgi:hypothetical protein